MSNQNTKFKLAQEVVYPSQGVGKITEIFEKKFKDKTLLYYRIYLPVSDMVVMVPVDKAEEIGIRCIVTKEEAEKAVAMLSQNNEPITSDWKLRYQMNLDLLKNGSIEDIAAIVRCLYNRSKVKELPILERKLYDSARKLLEDEISIAMNLQEKEAESLIHSHLDPPNTQRETRHAMANGEDDESEAESEEDNDDILMNDEESDDDESLDIDTSDNSLDDF